METMIEKHYAKVNEDSPSLESISEQSSIITSEQDKQITSQKPLYSNAYVHWEDEEEKKLIEYFNQGLSDSEIAFLLNRQKGGISSRIRKLGLREVKKANKIRPDRFDIKACRKEIDRLSKMQSEINRRIDDLRLRLDEISQGMVLNE